MFSSILHGVAAALRWVLYLLGFLVCLAAMAIWAFQWYVWWTKDAWQPLPTSKYISLDGIGWIQFDQAISTLLSINVGYPVFVFGILLMVLSLVRI